MRWWSALIRRRTSNRRGSRTMTSGDPEARNAINRARRSQVEARTNLTEMRALTSQLHHEVTANHLAQDIYDSMRRRK
jgi:hypothetical protein